MGVKASRLGVPNFDGEAFAGGDQLRELFGGRLELALRLERSGRLRLRVQQLGEAVDLRLVRRRFDVDGDSAEAAISPRSRRAWAVSAQ